MRPQNSPIGIQSVGHYLPKNKVENSHFLDRGMDTSTEWIESRTGILSRHIAAPNETTSDLATEAAHQALAKHSMSLNDIHFIIVATATPDHTGFPSTACLVQKKLGLRRPIPCFDITAACSGFTYGLGIAYGYIASGLYDQGLIIGAETLSRLVNWNDRRTAILFGDGAGAAIVGPVHAGGIQSIDQGADGDSADILQCVPTSNVEGFDQLPRQGEPPIITMDGPAVFKKGVQVVFESIFRALETAQKTADQIDYFVCHQANARILDRVAKKLGIPNTRFLMNINHVGNTSAASIPLVLSDYDNQSQFKPGDTLCLVGFGAGFTWGSIIIEWSCKLNESI
jgi:3-oxoacyl-[acyl-carrier-protein] synthase-3